MVLGIQLLKARDFLDRARLSLHRRSYWQGMAKSHPVNGIPLDALDDQVAQDPVGIGRAPGPEYRPGRLLVPAGYHEYQKEQRYALFHPPPVLYALSLVLEGDSSVSVFP